MSDSVAEIIGQSFVETAPAHGVRWVGVTNQANPRAHKEAPFLVEAYNLFSGPHRVRWAVSMMVFWVLYCMDDYGNAVPIATAEFPTARW